MKITRVTIAKDALAAINAKEYIPENWTYLKFPGDYDDHLALEGKSVKSLLGSVVATKEKPCKVCALGACFLAIVVKENKFNYPAMGLTRLNEVKVKIDKYFPVKQKRMMESAFERKWVIDGATQDDIPPDHIHQAVKFGKRYRNPTNRLKAILNNIIANRGHFKP